MGKLGNPGGWWSARASMADAIRADPQAHIDALVAAGVLALHPASSSYNPWYVIVQPERPHVHGWRVLACTTTTGETAGTVYLNCPCGASHTTANRLPIEVPE
jgi:hypothetical protein